MLFSYNFFILCNKLVNAVLFFFCFYDYIIGIINLLFLLLTKSLFGIYTYTELSKCVYLLNDIKVITNDTKVCRFYNYFKIVIS